MLIIRCSELRSSLVAVEEKLESAMLDATRLGRASLSKLWVNVFWSALPGDLRPKCYCGGNRRESQASPGKERYASSSKGGSLVLNSVVGLMIISN